MSIQNIGRNKWRVKVKKKKPKPGEDLYHDKRFHGNKDEALAFERKLSGKSSSSKMTFGEFVSDKWLPSLTVTGKTIRYYRCGIELASDLYDLRLNELTTYDVEKTIHALPEGDTRKRAKRTLSVALNTAVRWGDLDENPLNKAAITFGAGKKNNYTPYSADELEFFLALFKDRLPEAVLIVASKCGLGKEEALGLDWEDLDLWPDTSLLPELSQEIGIISVYKAWTEDENNKPIEKDTKNSYRNRKVYISGKELARLREISVGKTGPLWPGKIQPRITPTSVNHLLKRTVEKSGLRYIPINRLRHTYATRAEANGISLRAISEALGHAELPTTLRYIGGSEVEKMLAAIKLAKKTDRAAKTRPTRIIPFGEAVG